MGTECHVEVRTFLLFPTRRLLGPIADLRPSEAVSRKASLTLGPHTLGKGLLGAIKEL